MAFDPQLPCIEKILVIFRNAFFEIGKEELAGLEKGKVKHLKQSIIENGSKYIKKLNEHSKSKSHKNNIGIDDIMLDIQGFGYCRDNNTDLSTICLLMDSCKLVVTVEERVYFKVYLSNRKTKHRIWVWPCGTTESLYFEIYKLIENVNDIDGETEIETIGIGSGIDNENENQIENKENENGNECQACLKWFTLSDQRQTEIPLSNSITIESLPIKAKSLLTMTLIDDIKPTMKIYVKTIMGDLFPLYIDPQKENVSQLIWDLRISHNVFINHQILVFHGKQMPRDSNLKEFALYTGAQIECALWLHQS